MLHYVMKLVFISGRSYPFGVRLGKPLLSLTRIVLLGGFTLIARGGNAAQPRRPDAAEAPWERLVGGAYENRGVAKIERMGQRWVLTVVCNGTHTTYLDDTTIDLPSYASGYVHARYRYIDRTLEDARCLRAPCGPVTERRIQLRKLRHVSMATEAADERARECEPR